MSATIEFNSTHSNFSISQPNKLAKWIEKCIFHHSFKAGAINYVFTTDDQLIELNKRYLHHDTYTDIITFDYTEGETVSGDIFISIDRVRENAELYSQTFQQELNRVMIHGVLHLCGYGDKSPEEKAQMTDKEDYCLSLRDF
ncbi:MAG: rRNA maturation RNase YbeY [Cryomorphaceae bacterium]|nr:rRNA maturation RNase YbeY [Flavobacteriales bacterium]